MTGRVQHVVISAPLRRNALSRSVLAQLADELTGIGDDVTGVVLRGDGDAFSAGADFAELTGTSADVAYDDAVAEVTAAIRVSPVPVIAAIEGPCVGAAVDVALSCDLRIAAEGSHLQVPAVRLGLLYNPAAVARLHRAYPAGAVRRLLLLGERFPAEDAARAGLVSQVVARGEAAKQAEMRLAGIGAEQRPALTATRQLLNELQDDAHDPAVWERTRRELLDSPARREAVTRARQQHAEKES